MSAFSDTRILKSGDSSTFVTNRRGKNEVLGIQLKGDF